MMGHLRRRLATLEAARPPEPSRWGPVLRAMTDEELREVAAIQAAAAARAGLAEPPPEAFTAEELERLEALLQRGKARAVMVSSAGHRASPGGGGTGSPPSGEVGAHGHGCPPTPHPTAVPVEDATAPSTRGLPSPRGRTGNGVRG
jgi:hypothetical protein